jgi:actin-related protein 3
MGYAGNYEPNYIIPTFISTAAAQVGAKKSEVADLDFFIGDEAMEKRANYNLDYPIRHGIIDNWDNMERYWQRCIYQYMRCDPEEHYMLLVRRVAQCFSACLRGFSGLSHSLRP